MSDKCNHEFDEDNNDFISCVYCDKPIDEAYGDLKREIQTLEARIKELEAEREWVKSKNVD